MFDNFAEWKLLICGGSIIKVSGMGRLQPSLLKASQCPGLSCLSLSETFRCLLLKDVFPNDTGLTNAEFLCLKDSL